MTTVAREPALLSSVDPRQARIGRATGRFLSHGAYPKDAGWLFPRGVLDLPAGALQPFEPADVVEDVSHAWLEADVPRHPSEGDTRPVEHKDGAYTWCKAPRWPAAPASCRPATLRTRKVRPRSAIPSPSAGSSPRW